MARRSVCSLKRSEQSSDVADEATSELCWVAGGSCSDGGRALFPLQWNHLTHRVYQDLIKRWSTRSPDQTCGSFLLCVSVLQAEAWIKGKLRDLKDGGNSQCCPLLAWDRAPQTLSTDFRGCESSRVQRDQVGPPFSSDSAPFHEPCSHHEIFMSSEVAEIRTGALTRGFGLSTARQIT